MNPYFYFLSSYRRPAETYSCLSTSQGDLWEIAEIFYENNEELDFLATELSREYATDEEDFVRNQEVYWRDAIENDLDSKIFLITDEGISHILEMIECPVYFQDYLDEGWLDYAF